MKNLDRSHGLGRCCHSGYRELVRGFDGTTWALSAGSSEGDTGPGEAKHLDSPPAEGIIQLFNHTDIYSIHWMCYFARIFILGSVSRQPDLRHQAMHSQKRAIQALPLVPLVNHLLWAKPATTMEGRPGSPNKGRMEQGGEASCQQS